MNFLEKSWHKKSSWLMLLVPLSALFMFLAKSRRTKLESNPNRIMLSVPVIVIGNISAGGTGKTPVVIALIDSLKARGYKPGVISRGYGGDAQDVPLSVNKNTPVTQSGDEAKLIAQLCCVPVVVDPRRDGAYAHLIDAFDVDVVVSDDGLQHYNLPRTIEVAVVDGQRMFGNEKVFPAGPLREPVERLREVDFILLNGVDSLTEQQTLAAKAKLEPFAELGVLELQPTVFINQQSGEKKPFAGAPFNMGNRLQAVTGLGNPERFFNLLETLSYQVERYPFPDHHSFSKTDFEQLKLDEFQPVVMTEKDAIKCEEFAKPNFWTLKVVLTLPDDFVDGVVKLLKAKSAA
ncbi:MAG: tetraacyldisaccharide 4'-kinase [Pseudohongiellaceae bacterium]|jgi:tetraacyldisaccharide 4'-kinase